METTDVSVQPSGALKPVWQPSAPPASIPLNQYRKHINKKFNLDLKNSRELHKWTVSSPQEFWIDLWSYVGLVPDLPPGTTRAYDEAIPMTEVPRFFEDARINYAENVLIQPQVSSSATALIGIREGQGLDGERWSWAELRERVRQIRSALQRSGVKEGNRVAALISTSTWSVAVFLATASLGAVFTSIASDLGTEVSRLCYEIPRHLYTETRLRDASHACNWSGLPSCSQTATSPTRAVSERIWTRSRLFCPG